MFQAYALSKTADSVWIWQFSRASNSENEAYGMQGVCKFCVGGFRPVWSNGAALQFEGVEVGRTSIMFTTSRVDMLS